MRDYFSTGMMAATDGVFRPEVYSIYTTENVFQRVARKIRCLFCSQKQDVNNDDCEFCGAPLPDE